MMLGSSAVLGASRRLMSFNAQQKHSTGCHSRPAAAVLSQGHACHHPHLACRRSVLAKAASNDAAQGASGTSFNSTSTVSAATDAEARAAAEAAAASLAGEAQARTESSSAGTVQSHPLNLSPDELFGAKELVSELQDTQQLGKRGEAFFFAQAVLFILVLIPPFTLKGVADLLGTLLITGGFVFAAYGLFSLGRYLSPLPAPRNTHKLVTTGLYSYVRHPMYAGIIAIAFGLSIVTRNECRLVLSLALWLVLERKVALEEHFLHERYPGAYATYKATTKKFFPKLY